MNRSKQVMQKLLMAAFFSLGFAVATVAAQTDYCFQNDGLKVQMMASFTVKNNKIEGYFESGEYGTSGKMFDFTGTKRGNLLTIKFKEKPPYELSPGTHNIVWTLQPRHLKVPMYGKNYNTRKYSTYTATFTPCKDI